MRVYDVDDHGRKVKDNGFWKSITVESGVRHNPPPRTARAWRRFDALDDKAKANIESKWNASGGGVNRPERFSPEKVLSKAK